MRGRFCTLHHVVTDPVTSVTVVWNQMRVPSEEQTLSPVGQLTSAQCIYHTVLSLSTVLILVVDDMEVMLSMPPKASTRLPSSAGPFVGGSSSVVRRELGTTLPTLGPVAHPLPLR